MSDIKDQIFGYVAQIVSDEELLLNFGEDRGVRSGHIFEVIDPLTLDVKDPKTGESLGSIKRVKATIRVVQVSEHISLARSQTPSLSNLEALTMGITGTRRRSVKSSGEWPEGVVRGDPVVYVNPPSAE